MASELRPIRNLAGAVCGEVIPRSARVPDYCALWEWRGLVRTFRAVTRNFVPPRRIIISPFPRRAASSTQPPEEAHAQEAAEGTADVARASISPPTDTMYTEVGLRESTTFPELRWLLRPLSVLSWRLKYRLTGMGRPWPLRSSPDHSWTLQYRLAGPGPWLPQP